MVSKISLQFVFTLTILFASNLFSIGQAKILKDDDFEVTIVDDDYSLAYAIVIVLTNKKLDVIYKGGIVGEKDSLLFSRSVYSSDTLRQIKTINLQKLKGYYSSKFGNDGSQVTVTMKKNNVSKTIHLDNYYQQDIGRIIYLINSLVPDKYKVWYDKKKLQVSARS